jgi:hypothetical protein
VTDPAQHAGLSPERWRSYAFDRQVLMIANEMNRASSMLDRGASDRARSGYERVLALTDLTVGAAGTRARRRELLRWRDLVAFLYVSPAIAPEAHRAAFRALLQLTPASARQIPFLLPPN